MEINGKKFTSLKAYQAMQQFYKENPHLLKRKKKKNASTKMSKEQ
jgi:hypothetical protein